MTLFDAFVFACKKRDLELVAWAPDKQNWLEFENREWSMTTLALVRSSNKNLIHMVFKHLYDKNHEEFMEAFADICVCEYAISRHRPQRIFGSIQALIDLVQKHQTPTKLSNASLLAILKHAIDFRDFKTMRIILESKMITRSECDAVLESLQKHVVNSDVRYFFIVMGMTTNFDETPFFFKPGDTTNLGLIVHNNGFTNTNDLKHVQWANDVVREQAHKHFKGYFGWKQSMLDMVKIFTPIAADIVTNILSNYI